jgi:3-methyl-2-oxobutanoate hydroxymethyltransferase
MATAYDTWSARLLADCPVDAILVGDSAMMVVHGHTDTLGATTELMAMHTRAVAKGSKGKLIVTDMPFLAARRGKAYALNCAAELVRAGADAVKIEGIKGHADIVAHLVDSGIPVMGHLGLTPQSVRSLGGYTVQAKTDREAERLLADAQASVDAGIFALVLECIPSVLARKVTKAVPVPTIGIGAGRHCDGQILVLHDLLGLNPDFKPRFVRRFANGSKVVTGAVNAYAKAVTNGTFPKPKEGF